MPRSARELVVPWSRGEEIAHRYRVHVYRGPSHRRVRRKPPEPDISIVRNRSYAAARPGALSNQDYLIAAGGTILALAALSWLTGSLTLGFALTCGLAVTMIATMLLGSLLVKSAGERCRCQMQHRMLRSIPIAFKEEQQLRDDGQSGAVCAGTPIRAGLVPAFGALVLVRIRRQLLPTWKRRRSM